MILVNQSRHPVQNMLFVSTEERSSFSEVKMEIFPTNTSGSVSLVSCTDLKVFHFKNRQILF